MKGALDEWRSWMAIVAIALHLRMWALVEALMQAAMLALFLRLAAMRGIFLVPA